jgi:hypothetical protein
MLSFDKDVHDDRRRRANEILAAAGLPAGAYVLLGLGPGYSRWIVREAFVYDDGDTPGQPKNSQKRSLKTMVRNALRLGGEGVEP